MSLLSRLHEARVQHDAQHQDPWCKKVEAAVRDMETISTAALLDALRVPATTGTARRLAAIMRDMRFIPIKSRRLMPGGRAGNTVTRGWARPVRTTKSSPTTSNAGRAVLSQQGMIP
jgi:hypothetical protein